MGMIASDLKEEEAEAVKQALFKHFWPLVVQIAQRGFPEWYKTKLLENQQ